MHEMSKLRSLSLFVGTGSCNAKCDHCAGKPIRKDAPKKDGIINGDLIYKTIRECYAQGARYLSLSSSGEPTLSPVSVTKTLELIYGLKKEGIRFSPINLYSNGIRIGEDKEFCNEFLPVWKNFGLTTVYVTIHDTDENENAKIYGIENYPSFKSILSRLHNANLLVRANLVLGKRTIGTLEKFVSTVNYLQDVGFDYVSSWPIRNDNDEIDQELCPSEKELDKMEDWVKINKNPNFKISFLNGKDRESYETGQKLTLFPDGTLSNTWCNS